MTCVMPPPGHPAPADRSTQSSRGASLAWQVDAAAYGRGVPPTPPGDAEPDYRFTLANERTFLAWLRTALALLAAGIAVHQLGEPLRPAWARTALSLLCVLMAAAASFGGVLRWRSVQRAMRRQADLPLLRLPWLLTGTFLALAVCAAVLLVSR